MTSFHQIIFSCLLAISVTSCAGPTHNQLDPLLDVEGIKYHRPDRATIVYRFTCSDAKKEYDGVLIWDKLRDPLPTISSIRESVISNTYVKCFKDQLIKDYTIRMNSNAKSSSKERWQIISIPPGKYILSSMSWKEVKKNWANNEIKTITRSQSIWKALNKTHMDHWQAAIDILPFASFTVKPGEAIYLGEIEYCVHQKFRLTKLKACNNYQAANKYFKDRLPDLDRPLQEGIIKPRKIADEIPLSD